jgi:hypothetical protein
MWFAFEPDTGEWEVVGVPLILRQFWSSRRMRSAPRPARRQRGGAAGGSGPAVRAAAPEQQWEDVRPLEHWHADATTPVDDVPEMFASAVPGTLATAKRPGCRRPPTGA